MGELIQAKATVPSTETDKQKILSAIREISDSMTRIESEKDLIKDIADELKESFGMGKRLVNTLAKTYHTGNKSEVDSFYEEFTDFYESIIKS